MNHGFIRVACATPEIKLANCKYNAEQIVSLVKKANEDNVSIIVFPELSISGYTCGNLFLNKTLQHEMNKALRFIIEKTKLYEMIIIVGIACSVDTKLYNCAAVISKGKILGIVPKENIPNYSQYEELKYFTPGIKKETLKIMGQEVPFGIDLIFVHEDVPELKIGIEICEDLWVSNSPANKLALSGATVIANLSASDERAGKAEKRRTLINSQSSKLISVYLYANAGAGESNSNLVYSGHNIISENGEIVAESNLFSTGLTIAEIDLQVIDSERQRINTFKSENLGRNVLFNLLLPDINIKRNISQNPFLKPTKSQNLDSLCEEISSLQVEGLISRLKDIRVKKVVIRISNNIDSTWGLFIAAKAFDKLGYDRKNIICISTKEKENSDNTKINSKVLVKYMKTYYMEISIEEAMKQHLKDIGKASNEHDVTYENAKEREITQVLMDIASINNAIVLGTKDLSEIALGFSTYNGDHMSMYNVNSGVPKTVIKEILYREAQKVNNKELKDTLFDILNKQVDSELIRMRLGISDEIATEIIGTYELYDFFIYYFVRYGFSSEKILALSYVAFKDKYKKSDIKKCLSIFIKCFFESQFKRSSQPDGPKVLDISLSPRNAFIMPSDIKLPECFI